MDDDIGQNPALSKSGQQRARALLIRLSGANLVAIYADQFKRTQDTARPTLEAHPGLSLQHYFSLGPLEDTAHQWLARFTHGTVLVVGEPEAIAPLANTLCACTVRPLSAGETDRLIRIQRHASDTADGVVQARVDERHYGAALP